MATTSPPKQMNVNMIQSLSSTAQANVNNNATITLPMTQNANRSEAGDDGVIDLGNGLFKCTLCDKKTKLRCNMVNHINRSHKGKILDAIEIFPL